MSSIYPVTICLSTIVVVNHLTGNSLLSDKEYGFRACKSPADVLAVIIDRIGKPLDGSFVTRAITLDILNFCFANSQAITLLKEFT